jgi:hypothetical protein
MGHPAGPQPVGAPLAQPGLGPRGRQFPRRSGRLLACRPPGCPHVRLADPHNPGYAQAAWGVIAWDAETTLGIPVLFTERSLDQALGLDGGLDEEILDDFLRRVKTRPGDADQS